MSWKSSICPFPGWHLAWVVKVVIPSCVNKPLEFGFGLPGMPLGVHSYRAGSGIRLELPTRTSVSQILLLFWKISLGTPNWKSFSKSLPGAVAMRVKLEIFLKSKEKLPFVNCPGAIQLNEIAETFWSLIIITQPENLMIE